MKKIITVLLCAIFAFTLFGCSADSVSNTENSTSAVLAQRDPEQSAQNGQDSAKQEEDSESDQGGGNTIVAQDGKEKSTTSSTTAKKQSSSAAAGTTKKSSEKNNNTTAKSSTAKSTTKPKATTSSSSYITCTVTVECKVILSNMDDLKAGHEDFVPDDGYIIRSHSVTLKNGATAYDAVKEACDENGVRLNAVSSSYGTYVAGINNIDEKDCGSQSGWIYKVNNVSPSKSCAKYKLKNGDAITFSYVC